MIQNESFGEDATTKRTYHNLNDTVTLEISPDKAIHINISWMESRLKNLCYTLTNDTKESAS